MESTTMRGREMLTRIAAFQDLREYQELNWSGSFEDYLARYFAAATR